jgi:hypothetical protein
MDAHGPNSSSSSPPSTTSNKNDLSVQRIEDFVKSPIDSQIFPHHSSTNAAIQAHEDSMKAYIESFDVAYKE